MGTIGRRRFLFASGSLLAPSLAVRAQPVQKEYRIGLLSQLPREWFAEFVAALRAFGYVEGRNAAFEYRLAEGDTARLTGLAADLVAKKVDLIVAITNPDILAARDATSSIPIVMVFSLAPVEIGLVASLARPGGNITGTTIQAPVMGAKFVEILRDAVPGIKRITILWEPEFPGMGLYRREADRAAAAMGIRLTLLPGGTAGELDSALTRIARERPDALYVVPTGAILSHLSRVIEFAARHRLPAIYPNAQYVAAGGLISYSANREELIRQSAAIADRILKGANPADLPVEQPMRYEMAYNVKTAKALGFRISQSLLLRVDRLIE